jgi:hypothetical protein
VLIRAGQAWSYLEILDRRSASLSAVGSLVMAQAGMGEAFLAGPEGSGWRP